MAILGRTASEGSVSGVLGEIPVVMILVAGVFAPIAGWFATRRLRNPVSWFLLGALLGPLALILLAAAPPGRCPACDAAVDGWPTWCDSCGSRLKDGAPAEERAPIGVESTVPAWPVRTAPRPTAVARPSTTSIVERASIVAPPTPIDAARGGLRREPRPAGPSRSSRPTRTPVAVASVSTPPAITASNYELATSDTDVSGDVLSTGVYISGNAGLEIGACYAIARAGDQLRVFGPVDAGQLTIRHEGPLTDFDVTAMDDRVIIAGREGRSSLAIVFRTIGGMRAEQLESALGQSVVGFTGRR
jgi:hypothetical protein